MKGFYFIENATDEWHSSETAYFSSLKEAKEAMKHCADWVCGEGTGSIYYQELGVSMETTTVQTVIDGKVTEKSKTVMRRRPRTFVCRGKGLDENGNVIFTDKQF